MRSLLALVLFTACVPSLYSSNANDYVWVAPDNSWPLNAPPESLRGEGFQSGQVPPDFLLLDQNGDEVSLWQFYGKVIVLDISTMWCGPCRDLAEGAEETFKDFEDQDVIYLTVLQQNEGGGAPSQEDLQLWASVYGISAPVVADPDGVGTGGAIQNDLFPAVLILNRKLKINERVNPTNDEEVRKAIKRAI